MNLPSADLVLARAGRDPAPGRSIAGSPHDYAAGMEPIQCALLNILEDLTEQQKGYETAQRAVLNILEDFDLEKAKVQVINRRLRAEIEERERAEEEVRSLNRELERRVMERTADLTAANKELEAFSYSVSHDLRAPLRAIDGFCQALVEDYTDKLDPEAKDLMHRVRAASQRMDRLIAGILGLSRTTRARMQRTMVDLSALARAIVEELEAENPGRQVEIVIAPGLVVDADPSLLRAVLENLLGNAWKFTGKHAQARIEVGSEQHEGKIAYFVRDDGAGFDMVYADKLFGAFQRLHTPGDFQGTGIGLATVQRIIRRHGGEVWAKAEVEKGATFFFTLPMNSR